MARSVFVEQAAELLGVSRRTVYYRIREGRLATVRTKAGTQRVLVDSIEALLRSGEAKKRRGRPRERDLRGNPPIDAAADATGRDVDV